MDKFHLKTFSLTLSIFMPKYGQFKSIEIPYLVIFELRFFFRKILKMTPVDVCDPPLDL